MRNHIIASVLASFILAGASASAQGDAKPGKEFPDLGNVHIQRLSDSHQAYNSEPPTSMLPEAITTEPSSLTFTVALDSPPPLNQ